MADSRDNATHMAPDQAVDLSMQPKRPDMSLGELFGQLSSELGDLMRAELQLAKTEATDEMKRAGRVAGMFSGAGVAALLALTFLSSGLAWLLDQGLNRALSFALVGVLWAIVAAVLVGRARKKVKDLEVLPVTKDTLREDVQWAKAQKS